MFGILAEVCETCGRGDTSGSGVVVPLIAVCVFAFVSMVIIGWAGYLTVRGPK